MWTSQGLNLGPPDYESHKVVFQTMLFSKIVLNINDLQKCDFL